MSGILDATFVLIVLIMQNKHGYLNVAFECRFLYIDWIKLIALIQRVSHASVVVDAMTVGAINTGLMVLVCAERGDTEKQANALLTKLLAYRVFGDDAGKMNRSVTDVSGGLLLVPQFTLAADTNSGTRPSFTPAAAPQDGHRLFSYFVRQAQARHSQVATGLFGANMQVTLTNDGPVTFWLQIKPPAAACN